MTTAMDRAMANMNLEEVDNPADMPNLPEFSSAKDNVNSLIGRVLNPDGVNMASLILDMPRKWQKYDKVKGIALSNEKFQFVFKFEHDLMEILDKGVQTYNEWTLVMERWVESPPSNFLQFINPWVRIRRIPVNHQTFPAITWFGEFASQVIEVAFDPTKARSQDFVRVRVKFDVSKPLRRSKVINLPNGEPVSILYDYERVQKRCYECQRLTHEKDKCPLLLKKRQEVIAEKRARGEVQKLLSPIKLISELDPLYGVLSENQVGINPMTGRPRIAEDVLKGIRQYILVENGDDKLVRVERVKSSLKEVEMDPMAQKSMLRLEPPPLISNDLNKGKGLVFEYDSAVSSSQKQVNQSNDSKMLSDAIKSGSAMKWKPEVLQTTSADVGGVLDNKTFSIGSTVQRTGFYEASSSGTKGKWTKPRKRPSKSKRKLKVRDPNMETVAMVKKSGSVIGSGTKRQADVVLEEGTKGTRRPKPEMVPKEGLSKF